MLRKLLGNLILVPFVRRNLRRFLDVCQNPIEHQATLLRQRQAELAGSRFDRETGFSTLANAGELRRRLPLTDYDGLRPYIDDVVAGNPGALFAPGQKLHMFALTSGTTGEPKHIPVTADYLSAYRMGWRIWGSALHGDYPDAFDGYMLQVVSTHRERLAPGGVPCGAVSGLTARIQPRIIRSHYAAPVAVGDISDYAARWYTLMRIALTRDLSTINTPNPLTVLSLVRLARDRSDDMLRDIHDGSLAPAGALEPQTLHELRRALKPNPRRAKQLEALRSQRGELLPRDYWPGLRIIATWRGGTMGHYLPEFGPLFGEVPVRELGLLASEGRLSIPLSGDGEAGPLDAMHHLFEFIPESENDAENPQTVGIDEVEEGGRYFLVQTSPGGLIRYRIHDLVQIVGFVGRVPAIRFLNKGAHFASLTGEKLSEHQVVAAMDALRGERDAVPLHYVLVPTWTENAAAYTLIVETAEAPRGKAGRLALLEGFDRQLRRQNIEYDGRRRSNRLAPPRLGLIDACSFENHRAARARGGNTEQLKHRYLAPDPSDGDVYNVIETVTLG